MRIAIAHRSESGLKALRLALGKMPQLELAWTASEGAGAIGGVDDQPPQLLILDACIERPGCVDVLRKLEGKCPVLLINDGSAQAAARVYDGISAGATDVANAPALGAGQQLVGEAPLLAKLRSLESILRNSAPAKPVVKEGGMRMVLIGSSTGGPQALQTILSKLPRDLNAAYVIAQHVDEEFSGGLADWLNRETGMSVQLAVQEGVPTARKVLIAGTNDHLVLTARRKFSYTPHPAEVPYRPSADALFNSFAAHWPEPGVAVLLTGMGKDGAQGLLKLRNTGWHTIAQDAATCVVYGMPKAAADINAAREILPLPQIADAIAHACRQRAKPRPTAP
ncbi:MAG: chemotaxis-specific protein-glutamate methyltransferase CheB [Pseudomonadota bacterium]|jgi:chemotaxis response regulator CheB